MSERTKKVIFNIEAEVLKQLRLENKLSMRKAGELAGVSDSTLSQIENFRSGISKKLRDKLLTIYGISLRGFEEKCKRHKVIQSDDDYIIMALPKLSRSEKSLVKTIIQKYLENPNLSRN